MKNIFLAKLNIGPVFSHISIVNKRLEEEKKTEEVF
jgi:hypothetical protein